MKIKQTVFVLLVLALMSWGCGQTNTPEGVVRAFLSSVAKHDVKQAASFIGDHIQYDKSELPLLVEAAKQPDPKLVPELAQDKAVVLVYWEKYRAAFVFLLNKEGEAWKITHIRGGSGKMR